MRTRSIDVKQLPYEQQKLFFRLDQQYERLFAEQHCHKLKQSNPVLQKALTANLNEAVRRMIKKGITDDASRVNNYLKQSQSWVSNRFDL